MSRLPRVSGREVVLSLEKIGYKKLYGRGNWVKMKGIAKVRLSDGTIRSAEIHWFEAHGLGKKDIKVKYYMGDME